MKINLKLNIKSEGGKKVEFIYRALKTTVTKCFTNAHNKIAQ